VAKIGKDHLNSSNFVTTIIQIEYENRGRVSTSNLDTVLGVVVDTSRMSRYIGKSQCEHGAEGICPTCTITCQ
jgi:hypothetical protein